MTGQLHMATSKYLYGEHSGISRQLRKPLQYVTHDAIGISVHAVVRGTTNVCQELSNRKHGYSLCLRCTLPIGRECMFPSMPQHRVIGSSLLHSTLMERGPTVSRTLDCVLTKVFTRTWAALSEATPVTGDCKLARSSKRPIISRVSSASCCR